MKWMAGTITPGTLIARPGEMGRGGGRRAPLPSMLLGIQWSKFSHTVPSNLPMPVKAKWKPVNDPEEFQSNFPWDENTKISFAPVSKGGWADIVRAFSRSDRHLIFQSMAAPDGA